MYCPKCNKEYPADVLYCPQHGPTLIEKPVANAIPGINLGDANAISGGINVNASKNIHNEDRSIHNISNTTSTVNNVTQVSAQKTEMELIQERKTLYLNACKRAYEDNVLEQDEKLELDRYRLEIGLDEASANQILEQVHMLVMRHAQKSELTGIAKIKLKQLTDALRKNEIEALIRQIDSIEVLAGKFSDDELQRKYYLVLAALKEDKCIEKYTSLTADNYWQNYWSCLAYQKKGQTAKSEELLFVLGDKYPNYPEDNTALLAVACAYMRNDMAEATELLNEVSGNYTPGLQRFAESLYLLLEPEIARDMGATEQACAFYLVNFFGRNIAAEAEAKRKAEAEAKRKEEEAEAKRKAEAELLEAQRKAEEEMARLMVEVEAQRKAEEEALRKAVEDMKKRMAEEEAKRKAAEEEAKRKAEESYMLVIDGQQTGPFDQQQLQELAAQGVLTGQTYVWKQGMSNWDFAENVAEIKSLLDRYGKSSNKTEAVSYMLVLNGQQAGPYDKDQLQQLAQGGVLTGQTYVWKQGMANWDFAENVKELQPILANVNVSKAKPAQIDGDLKELYKDIVGDTYIETLHLNRSWVLPQFIDMGYDYGRVKKFSTDKYNYWISRLEYGKCWRTVVRNYKALAAMKDKSSYAYKIRSGWWTKEVAIAMAEFDLAGFKECIDNLTVHSNCNAGKYVKIPYMQGVDKRYREQYYFVDIPQNRPRNGWWSGSKDRTLPNLYAQIEANIARIRKAKNDKDLYEAIRQYDENRYTSDRHFRENWNDEVEWPDEFVNAFTGDGAYSSMMTMVKHLGLRYKGDNGKSLDRDECIQGIVSKVLDSDFDGTELLEFCMEKFFDSNVFNYNEYK